MLIGRASCLMKVFCAFAMFVCVSAMAVEPTSTPLAPSTASASPNATITQSVTELSAQRAAAEQSKINYPESLPRQRNVNEPSDEEIQQRRKSKAAAATAGKEHERGPKTPGIQPEHKDDGAGT